MTSTGTGTPPRRRGGGGWYILPGVIAVIGLVLLGIGLFRVHDIAEAFHVQRLSAGQQVAATSDGFSVYTDRAIASDATCTATSGGRTVRLSPATGSSSISQGSTRYGEIARTPSNFAAGRYSVSCTSGGSTLSQVYIGARGSRIVTGVLAVLAIVAGIIALFIALVIALIIFFVRRARRRRNLAADDFAAYRNTGAPQGYGQQPYQQPPYQQQYGQQPYQQPQQGQPQPYQPPPQGQPQYGQPGQHPPAAGAESSTTAPAGPVAPGSAGFYDDPTSSEYGSGGESAGSGAQPPGSGWNEPPDERS